jgi:hypothetical protein
VSIVPGGMQPLLGMTMLEMLRPGRAQPRPVLAIAPLQVLPPMRLWPVRAPGRRMMAEAAGPRLRAQVPFRVMVMMPHLGAIPRHDANV